ncbi:hypothetical protein B0J17DRAFT_733035 [Rhizoctonia solani]|nr:hypothetical protein B0J17DRAFT_733035 [Rhizoctonia solani]
MAMPRYIIAKRSPQVLQNVIPQICGKAGEEVLFITTVSISVTTALPRVGRAGSKKEESLAPGVTSVKNLSVSKMQRTNGSMESIELPRTVEEQKNKLESAHSSSPFLSQDPSTAGNGELSEKLITLAPLALHLFGSVAITTTLIYALDGRHFHLDRQPRVKLADGTYQYGQLGRYNILQSDVTTLLSVALVILRWVTAAWAGPLCWRVIFLLAGRNGLRRRDIRWVSSYGVLPPATHLRHSHNLLAGLILIFTLAPYPGSPLVTGSISWVPGSSIIDLPFRPTINLTGPAVPDPELEASSGVLLPTFSTDVVINFNTAWGQDVEDSVFKRVVPSAAQLPINSTVENVYVPFFSVSRIEWFPKAAIEATIYSTVRGPPTNNAYVSFFQPFVEQLGQPGAVGLVTNYSYFDPPSSPQSLTMLVNVARGHLGYNDECNSTTTFLPNHTTVPSFRLKALFSGTKLFLEGCYAYANVSYTAGYGTCRACRVGSYSTVQNVTELEDVKTSGIIRYLPVLMREYLPTLTPVRRSLPNMADGLDTYLKAALIRSHSALWNTWNDGFNPDPIPRNSTYKSAFSTLKAEVDQARVCAWLALQLSLTLAGLVFIWLQWNSEHPLNGDTSMIPFDIDSTEVTKPPRSSKCEPKEMLRVEPKGDEWRVVVASGRFVRGLD